jgi:hypothetical protein
MLDSSRDERFSFLVYDDEHHRMAIVNLGPAFASQAGLRRD